MIIYQATKREFVQQALDDDIGRVVLDHYRHATGSGIGSSEYEAWKNSLNHMFMVLHDDEIPGDAGVAIEYHIPQTNKRIDFVITGHDERREPRVIIVELEQWSSARVSEKDGIIWARRGGRTGESEGPHPSYQAWSYAALLQDFNTAVHQEGLALQPCAYLHNYPARDGVIDHPHYSEHIARAPLFLAKERAKLRAFIKSFVRYGDDKQLLYRIESGRIKPSKMLADAVLGLLQGRREFILIDDQKVVFETALERARAAKTGPRQVVIVQGGPGTGKSVVAINLLATLLSKEFNTRYVSKNAAPREVYAAKLTGSFKKSRISNLFSGSGSFVKAEADTFDVLVVDEAHRLNEKGGLFGNLGDHQVKEVIRAARCTVFFVDDDQLVTMKDIGQSDELRRWARTLGAQVTELELASQFRCNGSDGYLAWLDNVLGVRPTANQMLTEQEFDFRVLDSPTELHALIEQKNRANNKARVVAGYCWEWRSKKDPAAFDIEISAHGYRRQWNLQRDDRLWIVAPNSVSEVGCIHTCQGLELDYVGVIIGDDLVFCDGAVHTQRKKRARSDKSLQGIGALMKADPSKGRALADRIIKNTYRTLMTRGMRGCYVYCTDSALASHLRSHLQSVEALQPAVGAEPIVVAQHANVVPLRPVTNDERQRGVPALPVIDLRFAAGAFSGTQPFDEAASSWVAAPDWITPQIGFFVAQVIGESMNRRIPNGAWCLFRFQPGGTRQGKVVVAQHRHIDDPETGGRFTIKRYFSEKVHEPDGSWRHTRITLRPDSDLAHFEPIVVEVAEEGELEIVAEWLATFD